MRSPVPQSETEIMDVVRRRALTFHVKSFLLMSGMGHQRTFRDVRVMSALPPITDVDRPHQGPLRCLPSITLKNDAHIIGRHRHGLNQDKIVTCSQVRYVGEITHAPLSILRS
jgi:hypothetical protein